MFDNLDLKNCKILLLAIGFAQTTWEEDEESRQKAESMMLELRKRISKLEGARW